MDDTGISVVSDYARQITQFLQGIKSYAGPTPRQYASPLTYRRSMIELEVAEIKKSDEEEEENVNEKLVRIESPELFKVEDCNSGSEPKYLELSPQPEETSVQQSPSPNTKTKKPPIPTKKPVVPGKKLPISGKKSPLLDSQSSAPNNKSPSPSNRSPSPSNKSPSPSSQDDDNPYAVADKAPLVVRRVPLKDPDDDDDVTPTGDLPVLRRQKKEHEKSGSTTERGIIRRLAGKRRPESILREMEENSQKTRLANRRKPMSTKPGIKEAHSEDGRCTYTGLVPIQYVSIVLLLQSF